MARMAPLQRKAPVAAKVGAYLILVVSAAVALFTVVALMRTRQIASPLGLFIPTAAGPRRAGVGADGCVPFWPTRGAVEPT